MCIVIIANVITEQMYSYRLCYMHVQTHTEDIRVHMTSKIQVHALHTRQICQLNLNTVKDFKQCFGISCDEI